MRAAPAAAEAPVAAAPGAEVLYAGDPMCSWCWGLSPALVALEAEALRLGMPFTVLAGGPRPGGGDAWTPRFRSFLREHWEEVGARSGQPFALGFLDRPAFVYDTEPSCRAVVVSRGMLGELGAPPQDAYRFFAAIQRRFFAEGEDPTAAAFYAPICAGLGLGDRDFLARFESEAARVATAAEFEAVRRLGVTGFPTVLLRRGTGLHLVAGGFATAEAMTARLRQLGASPSRTA